MRLRFGDPALQVADQRLAADEEFVGKRVPRSDLDLPAANRPLEPGFRLRADLEIVIDDDCLAVHQETEIGVGLGEREQLVPEPDELRAEGLERGVPLAVPVGMRNDVDRGRGALRHS